MLWVTPPLAITGSAVAYNSSTQKYEITITTASTSPFTGDCSTTELWIDEIAQTCKEISSDNTQVVFEITSMLGMTATSVKLATATGYVSDSSHTAIGTVTLSPNLQMIDDPSTTNGKGSSAGGSVLSVYGGGFGTASTVGLYDATGSQDICESVEITAFGHFYCTTKAITIA